MSDIDDDQFAEAKAVVIEKQKCSPSWLQREMGVSFTTASALVTRLEEEGVVSAPAGNGQRKVLTPAPEGSGEAAPAEVGESLPDYAVGSDEGDEGDDDDDQPGGWDAEGEHTGAVGRMARIADELELTDGKRLVEDIRTFLMDTIKARPKPWSATSQAEKRDVAAACEHAAGELVRKVVEAIAARGVQPVRVLLTKVAMGGDIVITGKVKAFDPHEEHQAISILHGAMNKHVMLTVANKDDYASGEPSEEAEDFDQQGFGFEGGDDGYARPAPSTDPVADAAVDAALSEMADEYDDGDDYEDEDEAED